MTTPVPKKIDWCAVGERLQMIIDCLSQFHVTEDFKLDRATGDKAVEYCRRRVAGEVGRSPRAEHAILDFTSRHNQSLDWVLEGDIASMICMLAARRDRTKTAA